MENRRGLTAIDISFVKKTRIDESKILECYAKDHNLLISGGTDYHGHEIKPDIDIGYGRNNNTRIEEQSISLIKNIKSRYM